MKRLVTVLLLSLLTTSACEEPYQCVEIGECDIASYSPTLPTEEVVTLNDLPKVRVTCYCQGTTTASGKKVREGYVAASRDHIGDVCILYTIDHEYVGIFECEDTGGAYRIQHEGSVDVYRTSLDRCYEWVGTYGDYMLVQWIEIEE